MLALLKADSNGWTLQPRCGLGQKDRKVFRYHDDLEFDDPRSAETYAYVNLRLVVAKNENGTVQTVAIDLHKDARAHLETCVKRWIETNENDAKLVQLRFITKIARGLKNDVHHKRLAVRRHKEFMKTVPDDLTIGDEYE